MDYAEMANECSTNGKITSLYKTYTSNIVEWNKYITDRLEDSKSIVRRNEFPVEYAVVYNIKGKTKATI